MARLTAFDATQLLAPLDGNYDPDEVDAYGYSSVDWSEVAYNFNGWRPKYPDGVIEGYDGTVEVVEDFGGEGEGDQCHVVFKFTPVDGSAQYFRVDGYYQSYDGKSWEDSDLHEVRAVERVVTFYE